MLIPLYSSPVLFLSARSFRSGSLVFHGHNPCQNIVICCLITQEEQKNSFQFLIFGTQRAKLKHSTLDIHIGIFFINGETFFSKISNQSECGSTNFFGQQFSDQSTKVSLKSLKKWNICGGETITITFTPFFQFTPDYFISLFFQIFRALEKVLQSAWIQQYSTTVEIQLKAVRGKKFSTIAFVTNKKHPSDRLEKKNETSTNEQEK